MTLAERGIRLEKNKFVSDGMCKYRDEYDNTVIAIRKQPYEFVIKLRFADKNFKTNPLYIKVPAPEKEGDYLHVDYNSQADKGLDAPDISAGISMLTTLTQRWIDILSDIKFMQVDSSYLSETSGKSISDVSNYKYSLMNEYEELSGIVSEL